MVLGIFACSLPLFSQASSENIFPDNIELRADVAELYQRIESEQPHQ
jgi:hypothetical protein